MKGFCRTLGVLMCLMLVCMSGMLPASAKGETGRWKGSGQYLDPFLVQSVEDLLLLRQEVDGGNDFEGSFFLQTVDLDLSSVEGWTPMGEAEGGADFKGTYNGGGHTLLGLRCMREEGDAALFHTLGGTVMNLGVVGSSFSGERAASIAVRSVGKSSLIMNCSVKATVSGTHTAAGIVALLEGGNLVDCFFVGEISGERAASAVGESKGGTLLSCIGYGALPLVGESFDGVADLCEVRAASAYDDRASMALLRERVGEYLTWKMQLAQNTFSSGEGSERDPYRIRTPEELLRFRAAVNLGVSFAGCWIRQEADLDLGLVGDWTPIGVYGGGSYFYGVYDGNGHRIWNLRISDGGNVGLFGMLGGTVMNLGIESGRIEGICVGAITSHGVGSSGKIVNCCNKATVIGTSRAGGIADNFSGLIVNCLNLGSVSGADSTGGILSYSAKRVIRCYSVGAPVLAEGASVSKKSGNAEVADVGEAVALLNEGLYAAANDSDLQHNDLNRWYADGGFGAKHNYRLRFVIREILLALLVFSMGLFLWLLWKSSERSKTLRLGAMGGVLITEWRERTEDRTRRLRTLVALGFLFCLGMLLVGYLNGDHTVTRSFFWPDSQDAFMDFINPMQTLLTNNYGEVGHYTEIGGTYPPVARAILWLIGQILPSETQFLGAKQIKADYGTLLVFFSLLLGLLMLLRTFRRLLGSEGSFFPLLALFSSPMLFMIDRGNIVLLALLLSAVFVAGYRSENPFVRHASYLCLALAASIKIYPAVLGLLVVKEGRWKRILTCVLYGVAFAVIPFLLIGGWSEFLLYVRNVTTAFGKNGIKVNGWLMNYTNVLAGWGESLLGNAAGGRELARLTLYPLTALLVGCTWVSREQWRSVLALALIILLFPGYSVYYCTAFLAIPLMCFLCSTHHRPIDYAYAALFLLALAPLQFLCGALGVTQEGLWQFVGGVGVLLAFLLIGDTAAELWGRLLRRRKKKKEAVSV